MKTRRILYRRLLATSQHYYIPLLQNSALLYPTRSRFFSSHPPTARKRPVLQLLRKINNIASTQSIIVYANLALPPLMITCYIIYAELNVSNYVFPFIIGLPSLLSYNYFSDYMFDKSIRYLTSPDNPLSETPFSQTKIIKMVNKQSRINPFDNDGMCYGLTYTWYIQFMLNKNMITTFNNPTYIEKSKDILASIFLLQDNCDFTYSLDTILIRSENTHIKKLIEQHYFNYSRNENKNEITNYKKNYYYADCSSLMVFSENKSINFTIIAGEKKYFSDELKEYVNNIIDHALQFPEQLIKFVFFVPIYKSINGHIIGVVAEKENDTFLIRYFDSNFREAVFSNVNDAKSSLYNLIRFGYQNFRCTLSSSPSIYSIGVGMNKAEVHFFKPKKDTPSHSTNNTSPPSSLKNK